MNKSLVSIVTGLFLTLAASSASALLIDLRNGGDGQMVNGLVSDWNIYRYNDNGVDLTVRGYENGFNDRERVTRANSGLGVNSDGDNTGQLDGTDGAEWLRFSFGNGGVVLQEIDFRRFSGNDDYRLIVDGTSYGSNDDDPWIGSLVVKNWFAIGATRGNDEFRVASIRVLVPEPGALSLLLLGALGLGLVRRLRA